jgi:hypothetical protein
MRNSRISYRILEGNPPGKRPLGRSRKRWEDNVKMDLREVGCEDGKWIELALDRVRWWALVLSVLDLRIILPES